MSLFVDNVIVFGRRLRAAGIEQPVGSMLVLVDALTHVNLSARDEVFHACRTLLVRRPEQFALFERVFKECWLDDLNRSPRPETTEDGDGGTHHTLAAIGLAGGDTVDETNDDEGRPAPGIKTWSGSRGFAHQDIGTFTPEEIARARADLDRLRWVPGQRRTRRWVRGRGPRVDIRLAIASSVRTGGDLVVLPTRKRRVRPRPLVLLCDISGSMERYARLLLHFAHGVSQRHGRLEVFLFSTTLTRVTRELRQRRVDAAAAAVSHAVQDWAGGTRIGSALQQFHQRWSRRVLREGPVVLLISDGWDCGDPVVLRQQIARLQRSCHRLIWLSPLLGSEGYEPLTRGLQAALPYVDDFLPVRTLADIGDLALHLSTVAAGSRQRRTQRHWHTR